MNTKKNRMRSRRRKEPEMLLVPEALSKNQNHGPDKDYEDHSSAQGFHFSQRFNSPYCGPYPHDPYITYPELFDAICTLLCVKASV